MRWILRSAFFAIGLITAFCAANTYAQSGTSGPAKQKVDSAYCTRQMAGSVPALSTHGVILCKCRSGSVPDSTNSKCVPEKAPPSPPKPPVFSYTADGAIWRIADGYPKPDENFSNRIKADPRNRASADEFVIVGERNMVHTFSIGEMPDALEVGKTYHVSLTGVSVTPDDQPDCAGAAMIYVLDAPTKSIHDGKLVGSKRANSSFYVIPPCKRPNWVNNDRSQPQNWANSDKITFEFRPTSDAKPFRVAFVPVFGVREIALEFVYAPYRAAQHK